MNRERGLENVRFEGKGREEAKKPESEIDSVGDQIEKPSSTPERVRMIVVKNAHGRK